ncbi:RdgB/HAM1 family non-canonical purine NTP pyrophosphatase [Anatilimnocola floriformis]|uniref:RdgB/HAM1 family non-canonical purine NTP pyrophosphatase n=1 Tax=Anatilimnocola floriformis TaxID=2948575 RepID=UPI0020C472A3|nr:RdgB/HAM1 family non-canonical purine NTP pyrophosphatase [Anatilimnocola floriformis]
MAAKKILVMGTRNRKKLGELIDLLEPQGFELRTLADYPNSLEVEETGTTFTENAALKATQQARAIGEWVLGEDSGLAVDFLKGAPGVYSARFSGDGATDASNNQLLLEKLKGVPLDKRTAHYVCHATLSDPAGNIVAEAEDYCRGRILETAAGSGGFGYDPLFEVIECHQTFGELSPAVKSVLSHRSRAIRALVPKIIALMK